MTIILTEYMVINSVPFATPNLRGVDILPFKKRVLRGDNTLIPGQPGRLPNTLYVDSFAETFEARLRGDVDDDGAPTTDPREEIETLIESLRTTVVGSVTAQLVFPHVTYEQTVQVREFDPVTTGPLTASLLLLIEVPAGSWVVAP